MPGNTSASVRGRLPSNGRNRGWTGTNRSSLALGDTAGERAEEHREHLLEQFVLGTAALAQPVTTFEESHPNNEPSDATVGSSPG